MEQVKAALQKIHSQWCSNSVGVTFAMARLRSKCQMTVRRSQVKAALYSIDRAGHRTRTKRAAKKTSYTYSVPGPRYVHVITCSVAARLGGSVPRRVCAALWSWHRSPVVCGWRSVTFARVPRMFGRASVFVVLNRMCRSRCNARACLPRVLLACARCSVADIEPPAMADIEPPAMADIEPNK